jgi:hypothetical protein
VCQTRPEEPAFEPRVDACNAVIVDLSDRNFVDVLGLGPRLRGFSASAQSTYFACDQRLAQHKREILLTNDRLQYTKLIGFKKR